MKSAPRKQKPDAAPEPAMPDAEPRPSAILTALISDGSRDIESVVRSLVHRTEILSQEEERSLIRAWHERGDIAARDKLVLAHLKCVFGIARRFQRNNISLADLIHEGVLGLMTACDKFEPDRPNRFSTYAQWWVMTTLQDYRERSVAPVKMGKTRIEKAAISLLNKAKRRYGQDLTAAAMESIAEELGITYAALVKIENSMDPRAFSLNQTMGDEEGGDTFLDALVDEAAGQSFIDRRGLAGDCRRHIDDILPRLDARQRVVIEKRFLCDPQVTLKDLADEMNISPERVRQIQMEGINEMRRILEGSGLSHLDFFSSEA